MTAQQTEATTPAHYLVDEHYPPQPDLRALAAAADKDGQHIYTHWRDSNAAKANEAWCKVASPELVVSLLDRIAELERWQEDVRSNSPLLARLQQLEAQLVQPSRAQIDEWLKVHKLMTIDPDV